MHSSIAAPTSDANTSKPFKIGVTVNKKTLYLTKTTTASENIADGLTCTLSDKADAKGVITCNDNLGFYFNEAHPFEGALAPLTLEQAQKMEKGNFLYSGFSKSNKNFKIDSNNKITWGTSKTSPNPNEPYSVHFSTQGGKNQIFAEICSTYGHPDGRMFNVGEAKAYFV